MIVDTSAMAAILFGEPDAKHFAQAIHDADQCRISAATFVELSLVVERLTSVDAARQLDTFLRRAEITVEPFTVDQAYIARQAFQDFGKGRHPAGLNLGDCFSYALAKFMAEPLLFKGEDFRKTDILSAT
jgi:ribonuclease VapC